MTFRQTQTEHIKAAKKKHRCDWCGERINEGTDYYRWRHFDGGDAGTCKIHPECYSALQATPHSELIDGWTPGQFERGKPE